MNFTGRMAFGKMTLLFFLTGLFFTACSELDLFEKNTVIPNMKWHSNFTAEGTVSISDTVSAYNIYIILRHTDGYAYNNIWLNVGLQPPGDSMHYQKLNLTLGNDARGWEGTGVNDIWEVRKLISGVPKRFLKKGPYKFSIIQLMREDPLPGIMNVGLRLEKAG